MSPFRRHCAKPITNLGPQVSFSDPSRQLRPRDIFSLHLAVPRAHLLRRYLGLSLRSPSPARANSQASMGVQTSRSDNFQSPPIVGVTATNVTYLRAVCGDSEFSLVWSVLYGRRRLLVNSAGSELIRSGDHKRLVTLAWFKLAHAAQALRHVHFDAT